MLISRFSISSFTHETRNENLGSLPISQIDYRTLMCRPLAFYLKLELRWCYWLKIKKSRVMKWLFCHFQLVALVMGPVLYFEMLGNSPTYRMSSKFQTPKSSGLESLNLDVVQNVATGEIRKYGTWYTNYIVKEIITIILNQLNQILWTLFLRLSF